jgi:RNA polymerase sigma-70 factor (ECF subfamily)
MKPAAAARPDGSAAPDAADFAAWIEALARDGDRAAFAALFQHFAPRVKSFLVRGGASPALAEELAQETFVNIWRKASQFDRERAAASTWIFTIARNLRISQLRQSGPPATDDGYESVYEAIDEAPLPPEGLDGARNARAVREALAALPAEQARVLQLFYFEEQAHAAIADTLDLPLGTVKSRIRLAVAHLRRQLAHLAP